MYVLLLFNEFLMMSVYSCCFQFLPLYVCIAGMINNAINNKPKITPS